MSTPQQLTIINRKNLIFSYKNLNTKNILFLFEILTLKRQNISYLLHRKFFKWNIIPQGLGSTANPIHISMFVCVCVDICCYVLVRREVYVLLLLTVIHTHRHTHLRVSWLWIVELCESKGCSSLPDDTMRSFCFYGGSVVVSFKGVREEERFVSFWFCLCWWKFFV